MLELYYKCYMNVGIRYEYLKTNDIYLREVSEIHK